MPSFLGRLLWEGAERWIRWEAGCSFGELLPGNPWENRGGDPSRVPFPEHPRWLAPADPRKIIGVGLNYREHIREMKESDRKEPVLFLKAPETLSDPQRDIHAPVDLGRVDMEAEAACVIGKELWRCSPEEARSGILGVTCADDVTARDLQACDGQWTRAKSFPGFCPLGPFLVSDFEEDDRFLIGRVNGRIVQRARLSERLWNTVELVAWISRYLPLKPGDVVLTGTPSGVTPLSGGDQVEVEIEGLGVLRHGITRPTAEEER